MTPEPAAPSDRFRFTTIAHAGRPLLGPLSPGAVDALLARIDLSPPAGTRPAVLDIGCGKGEILVRAMTRFGAGGVGIDPNPAFVDAARARAVAAGVSHLLDLRCATFEESGVTPGACEVAICTGAAHAFGDLDAALAALAALVPDGGWALAGHGYWQREPAAAYLAAFGGRADELAALEPTLAAPLRHGWTMVAHHASTREEWDDYEHGYAGAMRAWLVAHPDDPDAPAFRDRIETWSAAYERWGCGTMGFVTMALRR